MSYVATDSPDLHRTYRRKASDEACSVCGDHGLATRLVRSASCAYAAEGTRAFPSVA